MDDQSSLTLGRGDQSGMPVPACQRPQGTTNAPSAGQDTGDGKNDLRVDLAVVLSQALRMRFPVTAPDTYLPIADAVLAAGWRPPLTACSCQPFDVCETCWGPEQQRESQMQQLAYCEEIIPCGPEDADQCQNLREPGSVHCAQHQSSPLPADGVEWGWCPGPDGPLEGIPAVDEATARERTNAARGRTLMQRRAAGPWVAVPVEPKETK